MQLKERIKELRRKHGLSQAKFAQKIGVSPGNVGDWETGKSAPGAAALANIAKAFGISIDWLLLGDSVEEGESNKDSSPVRDEIIDFVAGLSEEERKDLKTFIEFLRFRREKKEECGGKPEPNTIQSKSLDAEISVELAKEPDEVYLPLLGSAAAGRPVLINEVLEGYVPVDKRFVSDKCFIVRAKGDSMKGFGINDGDFVVIRVQPVVDQGEAALVRVGDEATIKYFFSHGDRVILMSANPAYKPIEIRPPDTVAIIGKVVHVIKREEGEARLRE